MKNIEIKTTQNVVLEYELADLRDRIVAFILDMVCLVIGISILSMIGYGIFSLYGTAADVYGVFLTCVYMFYSLAFEVLNNGQSIGKMAMRIQVIKTAGGHATFSDYVARWIFRMIDIWFSLGGIASILIVSSAKAQRIGDIVANTAVVKLVPKMDLKLKDLLAIHAQESYKPQYPQAKQLMEEDVLIIKRTLDRYRKFQNESHTEAIDLLVARVREVLNIEEIPKDDLRFLQTVLQDYVVLTR
jgi:uncharacterized RDD family membrane protein YckC